ncbi:MAG: DUF3253 domain-containing protein [Pseudomonadota bacterium]
MTLESSSQPVENKPSVAANERHGQLEDKILELCRQRGSGKSICPSEVARALECDEAKWRALMKPVRAAAVVLADAGRIDILRKGKRIAPSELKGVIRLRLAANEDD